MHGRWFCSAISCARRCFFTVSGKYVPPFTVASLAITTHSRPSTTPMPVTMPADGASSRYISQAASAENSRNGDRGSSSRRTRSRAGILSRATCRAIASAPPPAITFVVRSRSSPTSAMKCSRFAANSDEAASIRLSITAKAVVLLPRARREEITRARGPACMTPTSNAGMSKVFECVPNISEGRRADVIEAVRAAASDGPGVTVVDVSSDASHNRSVFTLVGNGDGVLDAAVRLTGAALERIDLRTHTGEHPRMGAVDVIPFIPIGDAGMDDAVLLARHCAQIVWERFRLPAYFYAEAATRPDRRKLGDVRKGQFEGLVEAVKDPDRHPDVGEPALHPSGGIVAIGARDFLIAYNVNLATDDLAIAQRIARGVRQMSGGFFGIQAKGFKIDADGGETFVQVSMNVLDFRSIPLYRVTETIRREAAGAGVGVRNCELVGLSPLAAIADAAAYHLHLDKIDPAQVTW